MNAKWFNEHAGENFIRTLRSCKLIRGVLNNDYETFMGEQPDEVQISEETFKFLHYVISKVLKNEDDETAMYIFVALKNRADAELPISEISSNSRRKLEDAMKIEFSFKNFIDGRSSIEELKSLTSFNVDSVRYFIVYAMTYFPDSRTINGCYALDEQSWEEFYWAVDIINAMMYSCCSVKELYGLFYDGLKDLRRGRV